MDSAQTEIERLEKLIGSERDPDGRGFASLADALLRSGEFDRAAEVLRDGLTEHGDFPSAWAVAGRVHRALDDPEGASSAFERALELDPENRVALAGLGEAAVEPVGPAERADSPTAEVVGGTPEEMITRTMGDVFAGQGLYARAIDVYERLAAHDPEDQSLQDRLTELRAEKTRASARFIAEAAREEVPDDAFFDIAALAPDEGGGDDVTSIDSLAPDSTP